MPNFVDVDNAESLSIAVGSWTRSAWPAHDNRCDKGFGRPLEQAVRGHFAAAPGTWTGGWQVIRGMVITRFDQYARMREVGSKECSLRAARQQPPRPGDALWRLSPRHRHLRAQLGVTGRTREVMVGGLTSVEICVGCKAAGCRHVGNTVPPPVARVLATAIATTLDHPFSESIHKSPSRQRLPRAGNIPPLPLKQQC